MVGFTLAFLLVHCWLYDRRIQPMYIYIYIHIINNIYIYIYIYNVNPGLIKKSLMEVRNGDHLLKVLTK